MSDEENGGPSHYETNYSIPSVNSEWNNVVELFHELKSLLDNCNREAQHSWAIIDKVKRSASIITLELEDLGKEISNIGICNKSSDTSTYIGIEPYSDHLLGSLQCRKNCGKLSSGRAITSSDSELSANNENNNVENREKDNVNESSEKFDCNNSCYLNETNACENSTDGQASYDSVGSRYTSARYNGISKRFCSRKNWRLSSFPESDEGISIVSKEKEEILKNIKKPKKDFKNWKINYKKNAINHIKSDEESKPDNSSEDCVPIKGQTSVVAELLDNNNKQESSESSTIPNGSDFTTQSNEEKTIESQNCSQTSTEEQSVNTSQCNNNHKPQLINCMSNLLEEGVKVEKGQDCKSVDSDDEQLKGSKIAETEICAQAKEKNTTSEQLEDNLKRPVNYFPESDDYIETILSPNYEQSMLGEKKPTKNYFETENKYLKPNKNIIPNSSYNDEKEQYNIQFCVPFTDRVCYSAFTKTTCANVNTYFKEDNQLPGQTQKLPPISPRRIPVKYCEFSNVRSKEGKKTVVGCVKNPKTCHKPIYKVTNMPSEVKFIATVYPSSVRGNIENNISTSVTRHNNIQRGYVSTFRVNTEKKPVTPYGNTIYSNKQLNMSTRAKYAHNLTITHKPNFKLLPPRYHPVRKHHFNNINEQKCIEYPKSYIESVRQSSLPRKNSQKQSNEMPNPSIKSRSILPPTKVHSINDNQYIFEDDQQVVARMNPNDICEENDQQIMAEGIPQHNIYENDQQIMSRRMTEADECNEYDQQVIAGRLPQNDVFEEEDEEYLFQRCSEPVETRKMSQANDYNEDGQMIKERTSQAVIYEEDCQQGTSTAERSMHEKNIYLDTDCEIIPYGGSKFGSQETGQLIQKDRSFSPPEMKRRKSSINISKNRQYSVNDNNITPYIHDSKKNSCDSSVREAYDNTSEQRVTVPSNVTLYQDIKSIAEDWNGESNNYLSREQSTVQKIENVDNDLVDISRQNCEINTSNLEEPTGGLCECKRYGCDKYCNLKKKDNSPSIATESQLDKVANKPSSETENNPTICHVSTEQKQLQIRKQNNFFRVQKMVNFAQQKCLSSKNLEDSTCKINFLASPNKVAKDKRSIYKLSSTSTTELSDSELTEMLVWPNDTTNTSVSDKQSQCNSAIAEKSQQAIFKLCGLEASFPLKHNKSAGTPHPTDILSARKSDLNSINSAPKIEDDVPLCGNDKHSLLKLKSHFMCQTENKPIIGQNEKNKGLLMNPGVDAPIVNFEISSNDKLLITTFTQYEAETNKQDNTADKIETVQCNKTKEVKTISTETSSMVDQDTKLNKTPAVEKVDKCENTVLKFNTKDPKLTSSLTIYDKQIKKEQSKSHEQHLNKISNEVKSNDKPKASNVSIKHQETITDKNVDNELNKDFTKKENTAKQQSARMYVNTSTSMEDDFIERYTSNGKPKYLSYSNMFLIKKNLSKRRHHKESSLNQCMRKNTNYKWKPLRESKCKSKHKEKHKHKHKCRRKYKCSSLNIVSKVNDSRNDSENINRFMTNSVCCPINIGNSNAGNLLCFTDQDQPSNAVNTENNFNIPHSFKNYVSTYINQNVLPMLLSNKLVNLDQINHKVVQDARETLMKKLFPEECEIKKNANVHDTTDIQSVKSNETFLKLDIDFNKQNTSQSNSLPSETSNIVHKITETDSKAGVNSVVIKCTKDESAVDLVSNSSPSLKKNVKQSKSATSISVSAKQGSDIVKVTSHQNLKCASGLQSENGTKHGKIEKNNFNSQDRISNKPKVKSTNYNKLKKIISEYSTRNVCKDDSSKKFPSYHDTQERKKCVQQNHVKIGETDSVTTKYGFKRSESNNSSRKVNTIEKNLSKQKSTTIDNAWNKFYSSKSQLSYRKPIKELPAELYMYKPQNDVKLNKPSSTHMHHFHKSPLNNYKDKTLQTNKSDKICFINRKSVTNQKQDSTIQRFKKNCNPCINDYSSLSFKDYISKQQTICKAEIVNMLKIMSKENGKVSKHDLRENSRFWISNCHVKLLKSIKKLYSNDYTSDQSTAKLKKKLFSKDAKEILRMMKSKGKTEKAEQTEICGKQKGGKRNSQVSRENDCRLLAKRAKYSTFLKPNIHSNSKKFVTENQIQRYENKNTYSLEDTEQLKRTDSIKKLKMCIEQIENKLPHFIIKKKHIVNENKMQKNDNCLQKHSVSLNTKIKTVCTFIQDYGTQVSDRLTDKSSPLNISSVIAACTQDQDLNKHESIAESSNEGKTEKIQTDNLNHDESFNYFEDSNNAEKVTSDNKIIKQNKLDIKHNADMVKTVKVQTCSNGEVQQITNENCDGDRRMKPIIVEDLKMLGQSNISTSSQRIRPPLTAQDFELSEKTPISKSFSWINNLKGFNSEEKLTSKKLSEVLCNVESKTAEEGLNKHSERTNLPESSDSQVKANIMTIQRSETTCNINDSSLKSNGEESKLMNDKSEKLENKGSHEKQQSHQPSSIENQLALLRQKKEDYIEKINSAFKNCEENAKAITCDFNDKYQGKESGGVTSTNKTSCNTSLLNDSKDSATPNIPEQKLNLLTLPHLETQEESLETPEEKISCLIETSQNTDKKENSNTSINSVKDTGSSTKINREKSSSEMLTTVEIKEVDDSNYELARDSFSVNILTEILQEQNDKTLNEDERIGKLVENTNNDEQNSQKLEYHSSHHEIINYSQNLIKSEQSRENVQKPLMNEKTNIWQKQKNVIEQIKKSSKFNLNEQNSKHLLKLISPNELKEEYNQKEGSKDKNINTLLDVISQSVVSASNLNVDEHSGNKNVIKDLNEENTKNQTNNTMNIQNQVSIVKDQSKHFDTQTCEHKQSNKYLQTEINMSDISSKVGICNHKAQENEIETVKQIDQTDNNLHDLQITDSNNKNVSEKVKKSQSNISDNSNRTNFLSFQEFQREISEMKKRVQRTMSQDRVNKGNTCKSDDHEHSLPSSKVTENDVPESLDSIQFWKQSQNQNFVNNKLKKPLTSSSHDDLNSNKIKTCDKVISEDTKINKTDHQPVIMNPSEFKSRTERKKLSNTYKSCRKDEIINQDLMINKEIKKNTSFLQTSNFNFPLVSQVPIECEKRDSDDKRKNIEKISVNLQQPIEIHRSNSKNILTELDMYHNSVAKWQTTPSIEEIMKSSKGTTSRKRVEKSSLKERTKEGKIMKRKTNKQENDGQKQNVSKLKTQTKEKIHEKARKGFTNVTIPVGSGKGCSLPIKCDSYTDLISATAKRKEPTTSTVHEARVKGKYKVEVAQKANVKPLTKREDKKFLSPSPVRAKSTDRSTPKGDCSRGLSHQSPPKLMPSELYKINQILSLDKNKNNLTKASVVSYLKLLRQLSTTIEDAMTLMKFAFKKENLKLVNKFYSRSKNQYIREQSKQLYKHLVNVDTKKTTKQKMCGDYDAATSTSSPKTMSLPAKNELQKTSDSALRVTKATLEYVYRELTLLKTQISQTMFVEVRNQIASNKSLSKSETEKIVQTIDLELNKIKSLENQMDMLSRDLKQRIEMEGDLDEFHTRFEKSYVSKFEYECTKHTQDEAMKKLKHEAIIETKTQLNDKLNEINDLIQHQIQEQSRQEKARSNSEVSLRKKLEHIGEVLQTELNNIQAVLAGNQVDLKENNEKIKDDSKNKYVHKKRNMFEKTCSLDEKSGKGPFKPLETSPKHGIGGNVVKAKQSLEEKINEDLKEKYLKRK